MKEARLSREQYLRVDGMVVKLMSIIIGYMIISLVYWVLTGSAGVRTYYLLAGETITLIGAIVSYIRFKGEKVCGILLALMPSFAFLMLMSLGQVEHTYIYVYAFPILVTTLLYSTTNYVIGSSTVILIGNIIKTAREIGAGQFNFTEVSLRWIILFLVCMACYFLIKVSNEFTDKKIKEISDAVKKQQDMNQSILETTSEIATLFDRSNEVIGSLKESIASNQFVVKNIADSTDSTAQAISHQVQMCNEIQASSEVAKEETNRVHEASSLAISNVEEGTKLVDELKIQAIVVEHASRDTVEATQRLMTKVVSVKDIISDILNISSQTNLLALNASIEAARAGEAGKGFAVVAEEIRGLSEQTKEATNKIINIIEELNVEASHASESVDQSVQSIKKQNEMIETTKEKFDKINEEMNHLTVSVDKMKERMEEIISSTGVIVDNISQLSATSEEIAASSEDGNKNAQDSVERMKECSEVLDKIYQLSQKLSLN